MLEREVEFAVALDAVAFARLAGILVVVFAVVFQEQVIDAEQERAAAAGDVGKAHLGDLVGRLAGNEFADGVLDDVADDVLGRVIDAAGLADFGFVLDADPFVGGDDDLAEEAFVDGAEDVDGDGVEVVGRIDRGRGFWQMSAKASSSTRKFWRVEDGVLLEDDAVVDAVEAAAGGDEVFPRGCRLSPKRSTSRCGSMPLSSRKRRKTRRSSVRWVDLGERVRCRGAGSCS